jgi:predicted Zn finger-like uncharacterized protein
LVVVCEKCETRFHLSDERIPAKGARVRCSRCKHAFFVAPPGGGERGAIEEVVAEVTDAGGTPAPDPAQDLFDTDHGGAEPEPRQRPALLRGEDRGSGDVEEDWEFNDDSSGEDPAQVEFEPPRLGEFDTAALEPGAELSEPEIRAGDADLIGEPEIRAGDAAPIGEPEIRAGDAAPIGEPEITAGDADLIGEPEPEAPPAAEPPPIDPVEAIRAREAELDAPAPDELGSPEDWDFVGKAEVEPPAEPAPELAVSFTEEDSSVSPSPVLEDSPVTPRAARVEPDQLPWATRLGGLASIGGWILVVLAFSVGMSSVFTQPSGTAATSGQPAEIAVSGLDLTATEVRGRLLENALVGDLLVVSGNFENRGSNAVTPRRAVWVQLVSATGEPIAGARAAAGRALTERRLREQDPDHLRRDLERSALERAHQPLRPGERVRFDAVFDSVPETATGWVLEAASSPSLPDPGSSLPSATPLAWE